MRIQKRQRHTRPLSIAVDRVPHAGLRRRGAARKDRGDRSTDLRDLLAATSPRRKTPAVRRDLRAAASRCSGPRRPAASRSSEAEYCVARALAARAADPRRQPARVGARRRGIRPRRRRAAAARAAAWARASRCLARATRACSGRWRQVRPAPRGPRAPGTSSCPRASSRQRRSRSRSAAPARCKLRRCPAASVCRAAAGSATAS